MQEIILIDFMYIALCFSVSSLFSKSINLDKQFNISLRIIKGKEFISKYISYTIHFVTLSILRSFLKLKVYCLKFFYLQIYSWHQEWLDLIVDNRAKFLLQIIFPKASAISTNSLKVFFISFNSFFLESNLSTRSTFDTIITISYNIFIII